MRSPLIGLLLVIIAVVVIVKLPIPTPERVFALTPARGLESDRAALDDHAAWLTLASTEAHGHAAQFAGRDVTLRTTELASGTATFLDLVASIVIDSVSFRDGTLVVGGHDTHRGAVIEAFAIEPLDAEASPPTQRVTRRELWRESSSASVVALSLAPGGRTLAAVTDDGHLRLFTRRDTTQPLGEPVVHVTPSQEPRLADVRAARTIVIAPDATTSRLYFELTTSLGSLAVPVETPHAPGARRWIEPSERAIWVTGEALVDLGP